MTATFLGCIRVETGAKSNAHVCELALLLSHGGTHQAPPTHGGELHNFSQSLLLSAKAVAAVPALPPHLLSPTSSEGGPHYQELAPPHLLGPTSSEGARTIRG